jgi:hypothetical protein
MADLTSTTTLLRRQTSPTSSPQPADVEGDELVARAEVHLLVHPRPYCAVVCREVAAPAEL